MKGTFSKIQNTNDQKNTIFPVELSTVILHSLFEGTQSSILLLSPGFRITFFNKHAQVRSILFTGRKLVCGESVFKYKNKLNGEFIDTLKFHFDQAIEAKRMVVGESQIPYAEKRFWVRAECTPVYTAESDLIGVLINLQDISDRKRAEYNCEQKQIQLDQIAWLHSHETRKPLATLLGLLGIFDKKSLTKDNAELMRLMESTALQLENVIRKNVNLANLHI